MYERDNGLTFKFNNNTYNVMANNKKMYIADRKFDMLYLRYAGKLYSGLHIMRLRRSLKTA